MYRFIVNGQQYVGTIDSRGQSGLTIGTKLAIFYDPKNPAENSLTNYADASYGYLFFVPLCALALIILPAFIYWRRSSWRKKTTAGEQKTFQP